MYNKNMRSLESSSSSHNLDIPKDPEGINSDNNKPKSFEEHMQDLAEQARQSSRELNDLINSLPSDKEESNDQQTRKQIVESARDEVLKVYDKRNKQQDIKKIDYQDIMDISNSF